VRRAAAATGSRWAMGRGWWGRVLKEKWRPEESAEETNVGRHVAGLVGAGSKGEVEAGGECGGDRHVREAGGGGFRMRGGGRRRVRRRRTSGGVGQAGGGRFRRRGGGWRLEESAEEMDAKWQ
jgi:hypothetical protein